MRVLLPRLLDPCGSPSAALAVGPIPGLPHEIGLPPLFTFPDPPAEEQDEEMPWVNTTIALTVAEWPESPEPWAGDIELDEPESPPED